MSKSLLSKRSTVIAILVVFVLLGLAVPVLIQAGREPSRSAPAKALQAKVAWSKSIQGNMSFDFSPGGRFVYTLTEAGKLSVYTLAGKLRYSSDLPGVNRVVLSPDARYTLAYTQFDPTGFDLLILDSAGKVCWKTSVSGAIWSADACLISRGSRFVVGTGNRCVYIFDVSRTSRRYKWWRAPGAVVSIDVDPTGEKVTYGTWQESVIARADIAGHVLWQRKLDSACLHYLQVLSSPDRMFLRSIPNRRGTDGQFCLTNATGDEIWKGTLCVSTRTRVVSSCDGRYVCMGRVEVLEHKGKSVPEKHAVLYNDSGRQIWEQGSMFLQVDPLLVSMGGEALLVDAKGTLYIVRRSGALETGEKLPGSVVHSVESPNGSALLVKCSDGSLCKLDIVQ